MVHHCIRRDKPMWEQKHGPSRQTNRNRFQPVRLWHPLLFCHLGAMKDPWAGSWMTEISKRKRPKRSIREGPFHRLCKQSPYLFVSILHRFWSSDSGLVSKQFSFAVLGFEAGELAASKDQIKPLKSKLAVCLKVCIFRKKPNNGFSIGFLAVCNGAKKGKRRFKRFPAKVPWCQSSWLGWIREKTQGASKGLW